MPLGCIIATNASRPGELASLAEDEVYDVVEVLRKEGQENGDAVDLMKAYMGFQSYTLESSALETMFLGKELVGIVDGGEFVVHCKPPEETARLSAELSGSSDTLFTELRMAVESEMRDKAIAQQNEYPVNGPRSFLDRLLGRPRPELPYVFPEIREQDHAWETQLFARCKALYAHASEAGKSVLTVVMV